jgi:hypothetical protein
MIDVTYVDPPKTEPDLSGAHTGSSGGIERARVTEKPLDLAAKAVARLRAGMDDRQKDGIKEWKFWWFECRSEPVEDWEMQELAGIISNLFFPDDLRLPLRFEWVRNIDRNAKEFTFGETFHGDDDKIHIHIDPNDNSKRDCKKDHHTSTLSTFVHELLHGYFQTLCCDGVGFHKSDCTRNGKLVWPGEEGNGHDLGWFILACQIDLCIQDHLSFYGKVFEGHLDSFGSLVDGYEKDYELSAADWKLFFSIFAWEEVATLFGHLQGNERKALFDMLKGDPEVMKVWADEGKKNE